jgi:hypothetical protein
MTGHILPRLSAIGTDINFSKRTKQKNRNQKAAALNAENISVVQSNHKQVSINLFNTNPLVKFINFMNIFVVYD